MVKLSELYRRASPAGDHDPIAQQILFQRHWINSVSEFDPKTGEPLPSGISRVLRRIDRMASSHEFRDHLWFIIDHCQESIYRIIDQMSESPRRQHEYLHVSKVRELDVSSFVALSYRPGRNIREKLSHKPQMKAVRRYQSIDLPQNQLFKEFARQLSDLLEDRALYLGYEDDVLPLLRRWLRSEEAGEIGVWRDLPPNNTLLSHPDYRRIWNSWKRLSHLETTLGKGLDELEENQLVIETWQRRAADHRSGSLTIAEVPVRVDIEDFEITTMIDWSDVKFGPSAEEVRLSAEYEISTRPVCIDLTTTFPRYAVDENESIQRLSSPLIWQSWSTDDEIVDLELFEADAAHLHELSTTYSIVDLFFKRRPDEKTISRAARSFAERLKFEFRDPTLLWLVPDNINEFRLGILRRSLNSRFLKAQPLPRSVAAVFRHFPYDEIPEGGITLAVLDKAAGSTFVTILNAEHDPELEERVPETRGFFWVRTPSIELRSDRDAYEQISEFDFVGSDGIWVLPLEVPEGPLADEKEIDRVIEKRLKNSEPPPIIEVHDTPVKGGLRYLRLQALAGDIPLWRDDIPKLTMSDFIDRRGRPGTLVLVPDAYPVRLVWGGSVSIPVESDFDLPKGQTTYRFTLLQGSADNELDFEAFLESDDFPLDRETPVSLDLTYTYGVNNPYSLVFRPKKFGEEVGTMRKQASARWVPKSPKSLSSLPVPVFPTKRSWADLRVWPDDRTDHEGETKDLLLWICRKIGKLWSIDEEIMGAACSPGVLSGVMKSRIRGKIIEYDKFGGRKYFFVAPDNGGANIYCKKSEIVDDVSGFVSNLDRHYHVWLNCEFSDDGPQGRFVTSTDLSAEEFRDCVLQRCDQPIQARIPEIRKALYAMRYPNYQVWNLDRTITESECPEFFRILIKRAIKASLMILDDSKIADGTKSEVLEFLSRMHEGAPPEVHDRVLELSGRHDQLFSPAKSRTIAYFIGACTTQQQVSSLLNILSCGSPEILFILSIVLTRSPAPTKRLTVAHMDSLLPQLYAEIERSLAEFEANEESLVIYFELLLGLLMTRASRDLEVIQRLSPDSEWGPKFIDQIERAMDQFIGRKLKTRVSLDVRKPSFADKQPDLLYALRLYLTGDDLANAIRIAGITDR